MALKLKSVLAAQTLLLLFKSLLVGLLLFAFKIFGSWWYVIALPISFIFYVFPIFNTFSILSSFVVFLFLSVFFIKSSSVIVAAIASLISAVLFYLILDIKNLTVIHRDFYYILIRLALVCFLLVFFLSGAFSDWHWLAKSLLLFFVLYVLNREFLCQSKLAVGSCLIIRCLSATQAFLVVQLGWLFGLLPLNKPSILGIIFLFVYLFDEFLIAMLKNELKYKFIVKQTAIFTLVLIVFFLLNKWQPL